MCEGNSEIIYIMLIDWSTTDKAIDEIKAAAVSVHPVCTTYVNVRLETSQMGRVK